MAIKKALVLALCLILIIFIVCSCSNGTMQNSMILISSESKATLAQVAIEKATAEKAATIKKAAAEKAAAAKKATEEKAATIKKATAEKAAAIKKAAEEKAAATKAKYFAQFTWYDSNFGVIIDSASSDDFGMFTANGRAISLNHSSYSYLQITIGLYSSNGNKIGSAFANIDNLAAGTTWQFEALGSTSSTGSCKYKVESVVGY